MKIFSLLFFIFILNGCCPKIIPQADVVTHSSDTITQVVHDTVSLPVPEQNGWFDALSFCDSIFKDMQMQRQNDRITSVHTTHGSIKIISNGPRADIYCNYDSIKYATIDSMKTVVDSTKVIRTNFVMKSFIPSWIKILLGAGWGIALMLAGIIMIVLNNKKLL